MNTNKNIAYLETRKDTEISTSSEVTYVLQGDGRFYSLEDFEQKLINTQPLSNLLLQH